MVSIPTLLKVLLFLEIHLIVARAAFWAGPLSGDCCWTPELAVKSKELSSNMMCALFCARNPCDSYHFRNGVCELSYSLMTETNSALFKRWKTKQETREIARDKPAQGSPRYTLNYFKYAVDGNETTMYHSANETPEPWFIVNLENNVWVSKVRILLLTREGFNKRTANIQTLLGTAPPPTELDFSQYTEVGYIEEPLAVGASWQEYEVSPPLCSRYVAVKKKMELPYEYNLIQLYEVEVFATF